MSKNFKKLCVSEETYDLIMTDCVNEFLENNPKVRDIKVSQDYIVKRIGKHYLNT